jgi:hypothetical protein
LTPPARERHQDPVARVHHLAILVHDLERAERFYCGVLGLAVARRWFQDDGAPRSIWLQLDGDAFLAIERAAPGGAAREEHGPGWHLVALAIAVEEREGWRAKLAAAGAAVERESDYSLYARDPEGNRIALSHWPVARPQRGGSTPRSSE